MRPLRFINDFPLAFVCECGRGVEAKSSGREGQANTSAPGKRARATEIAVLTLRRIRPVDRVMGQQDPERLDNAWLNIIFSESRLVSFAPEGEKGNV